MEEIMRKLAADIAARIRGLAVEESDEMRTHHPSYVRSRRARNLERERIHGMVIALSYFVRENDIPATEEFIERNSR